MARQRRGGFRTPELKGTLGTLLRTTLQQAGVVRDALANGARDALERGAREGRSRLDDLRTGRRRTDALAELGELVLELIRRGEIDLEELPEARDVVEQLEEIDAAAETSEPRRRSVRAGRGERERERERDDLPFDEDGAGHDERDELDDGDIDRFARFDRDDAVRFDRDRIGDRFAERRPRDVTTPARRERDDVAMPPSRHRFDERARRDSSSESDGTVSATTWSPPPRRPASATRIWRPVAVPDEPAGDAASPSPPSPPLSSSPFSAKTRGGISFDDEDLADYMHPDDVPAKDPAKDPPKSD